MTVACAADGVASEHAPRWDDIVAAGERLLAARDRAASIAQARPVIERLTGRAGGHG